MTKEVIQWGKTVPSINGVGETGKLYAKEKNWTTLSHYK